MQALLGRHFIIHIFWVFGINGGNFVKTMLCLVDTHDCLSVVDDQIGSPTYTENLALLLCDMIATEKYGVHHATNEGVCSWVDFAEAIFVAVGKQVQLQWAAARNTVPKPPRPKNSRMSKEKLTEQGFRRLPPWLNVLGRYLKEIDDSSK